MGQNSKARREAKLRERRRREQAWSNARRGRTGTRQTGPHAAHDAAAGIHAASDTPRVQQPPPEPPPERVTRLLADLAHRLQYNFEDEAVRLVTQLAAIEAAYPKLVDQQLRRALTNAVRSAFQAGWLPLDVVEQARRRLDERVQPLLVEAILAEHSRYSAATIDPRWQAQVDGLPVAQALRPDRPLLAQWTERYRTDRHDGLRGIVSIIGFCPDLPRLPRLLPLPGSGRAGQRSVRTGVDHKVLTRIRSLLAKAESTEFAGEADALSAKAQELMSKFSLDRALVEAGMEASEPLDAPTARRIWLDAPYVSAKTNLVGAVARANRCRAITANGLDFVTVLGRDTDLQLIELLVTSLLVQAGREMLRAGSQVTAYGRSTTRSYRHSFLVSYAVRIGERLRAATQAAHDSVDAAGRLLPVLVTREQQVEAMATELFPHTVSRRVSVSNAAGWQHGRTAADMATLNTRGPVEAG